MKITGGRPLQKTGHRIKSSTSNFCDRIPMALKLIFLQPYINVIVVYDKGVVF